jgi:hypothetical protein
MTQTTVLAPGNGAASSSPIAVAAGATVAVGLFVASGSIPANAQFQLVRKTPGADLPISNALSAATPQYLLNTPGTYQVNRITGGSTLAAGKLTDNTYSYVVTATNSAGETIASNEQVIAATNSLNAITVSWAAVPGATGYNVYRGIGRGGENQMYSVGNVTSFVDVNGAPTSVTTPPTTNTTALASPVQSAGSSAVAGGSLASGTYYYVVTATNASGQTLKSNEISIATNKLATPSATSATPSTTGGTLVAGTYYYVVTALGASGETLKSNELSATTTGTTSSVALVWAAVPGAVGYRVYRGTIAGAENVYVAVGNVVTYTDTNAANTNGTPPASNTAVTATNINTVNWAAVTGATGYKIYRGTAAGAENVFYTVGAVTSFNDTGAASTNGTPPATNTTGLGAPVQSALAVSSPGVVTAASVGVFTDA